MAHTENDLRPPDLDPGAVGTYRITHACIINGVQILHMELSGVNQSHPYAMGKAYDVSAVVHNPRGHAADATGSFQVIEFDFRTRQCILDLGHTMGRRMDMWWHVDVSPCRRMFNWQAWP